jgi:hypothetical protein
MSSIQLDCSQLRDIRLHSDLPNSLYIDGEQFLRQFEGIVQQMAYEKPLRKVSFRTKRMTSRQVSLDGYFHQYGTEIYENREGQDFVTQTIAIVESVDGVIYKILPEDLIFLDRKKE